MTDSPVVIIGSDMSAELAEDVSTVLSEMGVSAVRRPADLLPPPPAPAIGGKVIVVVSPKGGSGKTALASNLAVALAQQHPGQVAAVDLDVQFGDLGTALSLQPQNNMAQLARASVIDATTVKVALTPYEPGLFVLCAAATPEEADSITDKHVNAILPLLARDFAFVVVDTPAGLDERTLAAVECATDLLLVSSLDVTSIRSLRKAVDTLDKIGISTPCRFVLNRADAKVGLEIEDAGVAVGFPVSCTIPSSRAIPLSMNLGTPVVKSEPKSAVAKQFGLLASLYSPVEVEKTKRGWRR
jgi:pilus assembly protein CpaE